jgi:hypothetical protein
MLVLVDRSDLLDLLACVDSEYETLADNRDSCFVSKKDRENYQAAIDELLDLSRRVSHAVASTPYI